MSGRGRKDRISCWLYTAVVLIFVLLLTDFGVLALRRCHSLMRNNASSGVRIFFIVGFGTIKNRVQQFLHIVSGKICILVPNSSMKKAVLTRGASNPVVLYGWTHLSSGEGVT